MAVLATVMAAGPARGQTAVEKTVPFELDRWYALDAKEGAITLHRIRLERLSGGGIKARVTRAADEEFTVPVKVELEYSNASSSDWKAALRITWVDENGQTIDGYSGSAELDDKKDFDRVGGTVTTLKYGLAHARKLKLAITVKPD